MLAAVPSWRTSTPLPLNITLNSSNMSMDLPMNTFNPFEVNSVFNGKSAGFGNAIPNNGGSLEQAVKRSDVQRFALQNQLTAMYDTPAPAENLGQKLFTTTFAAP